MEATDPLSRTTSLSRDGIGRVTSVTNARGDTEHYNFDSDGNLNSVQNGRGKYRYYYYTARGELKQIQFADSTTETYKFDGNGNQTQRINGLSQTISYSYDDTDNLIQVSYPSGTPTTLTYDYDGRQSTMVDSTGTSSWTYDNSDNVTQLVTPQGTMNYAYDVWNRRSSLTEGSAVTNYGYTNEKLTSITKSADSVSTTFSYDSYGRLVTKNDGATSTTYGYDGNDRVNSIVHASSSGTFHQETYNYDYVNNLTSKVVNSVATYYTYDNIDQLLTESTSAYSYGYAYDANGNRTSKTYGLNIDTYTYDDADKLTSMTKPSGTATYSYDACGRMTSVSGLYTRNYAWDYEDRMTSAGVSGLTPESYGYNGVGSRVTKSGPYGSRTYKRDGVGVTAPVLSDGIATMVPGISEKTSSGTSTVHTDRLGSMKAMSSSGSVTDTAEYDAFGNVLSRTGSSLTQKGFAGNFGYQEDGESGLKLLGHRYYDPETGRFICRDPIRAGKNWYSYCENNPIKSVDSNGLSGDDTPAIASLGLLRIIMDMPEPMRSRVLYWLFSITPAVAAEIIEKADEFLSGEASEEAAEQGISAIFEDSGVSSDALSSILHYKDDGSFFPFISNGTTWAVRYDSAGNRVTSIALYNQGKIWDRLDLASFSGRFDHVFPHLHWYLWPGKGLPVPTPGYPGIPPHWPLPPSEMGGL